MTTPAALKQQVVSQSARTCPPALDTVADLLIDRFGDGLDAVLFYGSCLRSADPTDGLIDVYALVSDFRRAYRQRRLRWLNRVLPPNVFYIEEHHAGVRLRIKCTVFSLAGFERGIRHWFHPYLWGRFAQPVRLLWARDDRVRNRVHEALAEAVLVFLRKTLPCLEGPQSIETLWMEGLRRSYTTELRAEGKDRARQLVAADRGDYQARTVAAAPALGLQMQADGSVILPARRVAVRLRARVAWAVRRWQGRGISILRLLKNSTTFRGGVDYVAWKIERHTGVKVEVTPRLRRYPFIFGWGVLFRLLRQGTVR